MTETEKKMQTKIARDAAEQFDMAEEAYAATPEEGEVFKTVVNRLLSEAGATPWY
jgi:hypothetical protein